MSRTTVGIVRGGTSSEYAYSLKTGAAMLNALSPEQYDVRDIFIDKTGLWHLRGMPIDAHRALSQVDVVLNALHGGIGEDGTVQRIFEQAGVPHVGAPPFAAARALNKISAREILRSAGVLVPAGVGFSHSSALDAGAMARDVFAHVGPPYIVKPATEGASQGVRYVATFIDLPQVIADTLDAFGSVLVEEYVVGTEAKVGIIEGFRNEGLYALPPASVAFADDARHIAPHHYADGLLSHTAPSAFSHEEKQALIGAARTAHEALQLSHLSSADFIVTKHGPVLLEVDSLPYLYEGAAFPVMLDSVGASLSDLLSHLIKQARA